MNGSTLKTLLALGIAHVTITSSEAGKEQEDKKNSRSFRKHQARQERNSARKERLVEHALQSGHNLANTQSVKNPPSRTGSDEAKESSILLSEESENPPSQKSSQSPQAIEVLENLGLVLDSPDSCGGIEILGTSPAEKKSSSSVQAESILEGNSVEQPKPEAPVVAVNEAPVQAENAVEAKESNKLADPIPASQEEAPEAALDSASAASEAPVQAENGISVEPHNPEVNPAPGQQENAKENLPSARMTEEEMRKIFEELQKIQRTLRSEEMVVELVKFLHKVALSSPLQSNIQKEALNEIVRNTIESFSFKSDLIKQIEALTVGIKAEKNFFEQDHAQYERELETHTESLQKAKEDLDTYYSLNWHVNKIEGLETKKRDCQKDLQHAQKNLIKLDAAHKKCTDAEKKPLLLLAYEACKNIIHTIPERINELNDEIQSASDLKNLFLRVTDNEKKLHALESEIATATSQSAKDELEADKRALEDTLRQDKMNAYYEQINVLRNEKTEQEKKVERTQEALDKLAKKIEDTTHHINFYELDWESYIKIVQEKAETERTLKAQLEANEKKSKQQEKEISNLQRGKASLMHTIKNLEAEREEWNSHKKKRGIFSKMNPFKLFKRKRKHADE